MKTFLLCQFLFALGALSASANFPADISKRFKEMNSVKVEMRQEKFVSLLEEKIVADILLVADSKGRIRWQTGKIPQSIAILSEGKLSRFELANGKYAEIKSRADSAILPILKKITQMALCDFSGCKNNFDMTFKNGVVTLVPKSENLICAISKIEITLNSNSTAPSKIRIDAPDGDWTIYKIIKITEDPQDLEKAFDTKNPEAFGKKSAWSRR